MDTSEANATEPTSRRVARRILVAEDNPFNRALLAGMLSRIGIEHRIVEDGTEAVEALRHEFFDVVLMDLHMPVMDGFEAARQIRRLSRAISGAAEGALKPVKVIALTADTSDPRDGEDGDLFDDVLLKPIQSGDLLRILGAGWTPDFATTASPDPEILDSVYGLRVAGGVRSQFVVLAQLFLEHTPDLLSSLDLSIQLQKYEDTALHAHSLQGSAACIGGLQLSSSAGILKQAASARSDWPAIRTLRERVDSQWVALRRLLHEISLAP